MLIFGLMGQIAWVVENMYFNVFIYKMFHASAADISAMVMASAVTAAVTTIVMGAVSDKVGKRKAFLIISACLVVASFAVVGLKGMTFGIEFVDKAIDLLGIGEVLVDYLPVLFLKGIQAGLQLAVLLLELLFFRQSTYGRAQ